MKRGVWWCMLVWSNVLSAHGDRGWHQCWVTGQCLGLKLWQITVSESYRHETCLKHKENHMPPWLLETCFPCLVCCANNRGNFLELLFWRFFHQSTEMLVIILLSEGLKASLTPFRRDSWEWYGGSERGNCWLTHVYVWSGNIFHAEITHLESQNWSLFILICVPDRTTTLMCSCVKKESPPDF